MKNPVAKSLRSAHLRQQIVAPKKGRGSYDRKIGKESDES